MSSTDRINREIRQHRKPNFLQLSTTSFLSIFKFPICLYFVSILSNHFPFPCSFYFFKSSPYSIRRLLTFLYSFLLHFTNFFFFYFITQLFWSLFHIFCSLCYLYLHLWLLSNFICFWHFWHYFIFLLLLSQCFYSNLSFIIFLPSSSFSISLLIFWFHWFLADFISIKLHYFFLFRF